jgi:hypothetical protein
MSFSTNDFDKWMKRQGTRPPTRNTLTDEQIRILKNYPECQTANDLPFDIQQDIIALNDLDNATTTDGNLQNEVDGFLENQYSLLSRKFFLNKDKEKA